MEKKFKIVGGPSLDDMFHSFRTHETKGTQFQLENTDLVTGQFIIGSITYKDGHGTTFDLEGECKTRIGEDHFSRFSATYCAKERNGEIILS